MSESETESISQKAAVLVLFAVASGVLAFHLLANSAADFDPERDGLGKNWKSIATVRSNGLEVKGETEEVAKTIHAAKTANKLTTLLVGASQLHTVSNYRDGDSIAVDYLNRALEKSDARHTVVQLSYGNANVHEMLCMISQLEERDALPDQIVVGFTYDDLREPGIRDKFRVEAAETLAEVCGDTFAAVGNILSQKTSDKKKTRSPVARTDNKASLQERVEESIVEKIESTWPAYAARGRLQGKIELGSKETITRFMLGKNRRSSIKVTQTQESDNFLSLAAIKKFTSHHGVKLRIYRAALLKTEGYSYYNRKEYAAAWERVESFASKNEILTRDFDSAVPNERFGITNSGLPDYFHFDDDGHRILGLAMAEWLGN